MDSQVSIIVKEITEKHKIKIPASIWQDFVFLMSKYYDIEGLGRRAKRFTKRRILAAAKNLLLRKIDKDTVKKALLAVERGTRITDYGKLDQYSMIWEFEPVASEKTCDQIIKTGKPFLATLCYARYRKEWRKYFRNFCKYSPMVILDEILYFYSEEKAKNIFHGIMQELGIEVTAPESPESYGDFYIYNEEWLPTILGTRGKETLKLAREKLEENRELIRWASALAWGKPDFAQKILNLDWTIPYLSGAVKLLNSLPFETTIRLLQQKSYKAFREEVDVTSGLIEETAQLWSELYLEEKERIKKKRIRCWYSLNRDVLETKSMRFLSKKIEVPTEIRHINNLSSIDKRWRVSFPRTGREIFEWGKVLNNCLSISVEEIATKNRYSVAGVFVNSELRFAIRIEKKVITEFRGYGNSDPPEDLYFEIVEELMKAGLDVYDGANLAFDEEE